MHGLVIRLTLARDIQLEALGGVALHRLFHTLEKTGLEVKSLALQAVGPGFAIALQGIREVGHGHRLGILSCLDDHVIRADKADRSATEAARAAENAEFLEEYRRNRKPHSAEEIAEMRAAFGPGTKVVDIITGETINL
jgi:hypothetical protein